MSRAKRAAWLVLLIAVVATPATWLARSVASVSRVRRHLAASWGYPARRVTGSDIDIALGLGHEFRLAPSAAGVVPPPFSIVDVTLSRDGRTPPRIVEVSMGRASAPVVAARAFADENRNRPLFVAKLAASGLGVPIESTHVLNVVRQGNHDVVNVCISHPPPHVGEFYRVDLFPPDGIYYIEQERQGWRVRKLARDAAAAGLTPPPPGRSSRTRTPHR